MANEIRPEAETTLVFFDAERETAKVMVLPRNPASSRFFARRTARVKSRVVGERWANNYISTFCRCWQTEVRHLLGDSDGEERLKTPQRLNA